MTQTKQKLFDKQHTEENKSNFTLYQDETTGTRFAYQPETTIKWTKYIKQCFSRQWISGMKRQ